MQSTPQVPETLNSSPPRFTEKFDQIFVNFGGNTLSVKNRDGAHLALIGFDSRGRFIMGAGQQLETELAAVNVKDGKLLVDAVVFVGPHQPSMRVLRNNISGRPGDWDKNEDNAGSLEIVNENQLPVLQIIYSDQIRVAIKGIFIHKEQAFIVDSELDGMPKQDAANYKIKRLFKYPSRKYPGVLEETKD